MNAAANAELYAAAPRHAPEPSGGRDAVRWIARQLEWERTLDALRADGTTEPERRAA